MYSENMHVILCFYNHYIYMNVLLLILADFKLFSSMCV